MNWAAGVKAICLCLFTFFNVIPELVLTGAFLKGFWEFDWTSAEVPEKDPEGVDVHRVIILSCEKRRHNAEETFERLTTFLHNWVQRWHKT